MTSLKQRFLDILPALDFCSLRVVSETSHSLMVRQDVPQPPYIGEDTGAMLTVIHQGGLGYAATADLTSAGLREALERAMAWAERTRNAGMTDFSKIAMPHPRGEYQTPLRQDWDTLSLRAKLDLLQEASAQSKLDSRIVDWYAYLNYTRSKQSYFTSEGGEVEQVFHYLFPSIGATAYADADSQSRSLGGQGIARQGGLEILEHLNFREQGRRTAEEALELVAAPNCPEGAMDLVLAPDQMMLQIHESIGHPLELDRILGDERNYAGTSFVTLDMLGTYQYGSELLNVSFDPTPAGEFANYAYDDEGLEARKEYLIRHGILQRPLGGVLSQARSGLAGTANARADSWNRPPIDRMGNLNVEPGAHRFEDIVASVERGIFMQSNRSWSIDDSRNKFQFGCEWAQLIENGRLTKVVKNPNYRGISATFWRNLQAVGDAETFEVLGVPYCGKGEPNQIIRVGHAAPVCLFGGVDVFGGA